MQFESDLAIITNKMSADLPYFIIIPVVISINFIKSNIAKAIIVGVNANWNFQ